MQPVGKVETSWCVKDVLSLSLSVLPREKPRPVYTGRVFFVYNAHTHENIASVSPGVKRWCNGSKHNNKRNNIATNVFHYCSTVVFRKSKSHDSEVFNVFCR